MRPDALSFARMMLSAKALLLASAIAAQAEPLAIGHTRITFLDPARGNREVQTEIYYPADQAGENVPVGGPAGTQYPVIAIGHGFLLPVSAYDYLWSALVPAGSIVALPTTEGDLSPSHLDLGLDLAFLVAEIRRDGTGNPSSLFYDRVAETSAVMGHSMGGGASFLSVPANPAITAIANLAAAETSPSAIQAAGSITIPALIVSGSHDCVTPPAQHQIPMYEALVSDCKTFVSLTGASHCQFAASNTLCSLGEIGCSPPTITRAQQQARTVALLLPWLDYTLRGDLTAWQAFQDLLVAGEGLTWLQDCDRVAVSEESPTGSGGPLQLMIYPEPFIHRTTVQFDIVVDTSVRIDVYDVAGRLVRSAFDRPLAPGRHLWSWDGRAGNGRLMPAGAYYLRATAGPSTVSRKITRLP